MILHNFLNAQNSIEKVKAHLKLNTNPTSQINYIKENLHILRKNPSDGFIDSLIENYISNAKLKSDQDSVLNFFNAYFKIIKNSQKGLFYANEYLNAASQQKDANNIVLANIAIVNNLDNSNLIRAREAIENAKVYASKATDKNLAFELNICEAELLNFENKKIEAYRLYSAIILKEKVSENNGNLIIAQNKLLDFYINNHSNKKAETLCNNQKELINSVANIDSLTIIKTIFQLCQVYNLTGNTNDFKYALTFGIEYCIKNEESILKNNFLALLRKEAFDKNDFSLMEEYYFNKFPGLLNEIAEKDSVNYFKIIAMQFEKYNKNDSAIFYLNKAETANAKNSQFSRANFNFRLGEFYERLKKTPEAIKYYTKAFDINKSIHYFPWIKNAAEKLSVLFAQQNKFDQAFYYSNQVILYTDSIKIAANLEKQLELDIENELILNKKLEEVKILKAEKQKNIQYMLATILILVLFIALLLISATKIPQIVIRAIAFISFIFLFEFIILVADEKIHHITHGQPLKILGIKIILIAILMPLHHWIEHKVLHFLFNNKIFEINKIKSFFTNALASLKSKFKEEKRQEEEEILSNKTET